MYNSKKNVYSRKLQSWYKYELTGTVTAWPRPTQAHIRQSSTTKNWEESQRPYPEAIPNREGKISLLQWSDRVYKPNSRAGFIHRSN